MVDDHGFSLSTDIGYGYYGHGLGYAAYAGYHPYAYYGGCRNGYGALVPCAGK